MSKQAPGRSERNGMTLAQLFVQFPDDAVPLPRLPPVFLRPQGNGDAVQ